MKNVFDFLQDYVPQVTHVPTHHFTACITTALCITVQAVSGPKDEKRDRVLWARFETCDLNDLTMEHNGNSDKQSLLLILGTANGFSVWLVPVSPS